MAWLVAVGLVVLLLAAASVKRVGQNERGLVFRTGRLRERVLRPGTVVLVPFVDRLERVDVSETVVEVPFTGPAMDGRRARVDAVLTFWVVDPAVATTAVQNHRTAICQLALVVLRTEAEQRTFGELTTAREELRRALVREVAPAAAGWGVRLDRVELRSVTAAEPSAPEPNRP
ncbi:SPFH domain-containing protein [Kitasatospora sp. CB02891]|uniref:SPFH domain-containing protein n=1 Tax=Kitasatospora sp. CB02891 TaxID=2020329 RepID=UPI0012FE60B0|nr:SPFH domain-containing protein [Kitasatospora sp. CB02891]